MSEVIYNPLEEFETKFKPLHEENIRNFFDDLVAQSGIDIEKNRKTLEEHKTCKESTGKLQKKLDWLRFWRVLMCISLVLIPVVILKTTPAIKALREEIKNAKKRANDLLADAGRQMEPLLQLFTTRDSLNLVEKTLPQLIFEDYFSARQEAHMRHNFDLTGFSDKNRSAMDILSGSCNDNPFFYEKVRTHKMGFQTYHGHKDIEYTKRYRDSEGKWQTKTETQTLHATVVKPKPFYSTQLALNYCHQGGPDLSFSRDATHLERKSEKEIERLVKRGEKKLDKKAQKAIKKNESFVSMSNGDFEVLFDALNRTDEVQFRTLFTPLAQTNMVDLLLSKTGYGDDFDFIKTKRTNRIIARHSQNRALNLLPGAYHSNSFDEIKEKFISKNNGFFKAIYFDFAPLWAIPLYQESPTQSLLEDVPSRCGYSLKEYEALANGVHASKIYHPKTKTNAILNVSVVSSGELGDEISVTAYSYDMEKRVTGVPTLGNDLKLHTVNVEWYEYLPLTQTGTFTVATKEAAADKEILASRNDLCIYKS